MAGNKPKTFKAETVESAENKEIVRKLSTVSGEFRPISGSCESDVLVTSSQQGLSSSDINVDDSAPSERVSSLSSNKRKRRKRSLMKKKNSNNSNNGNNSHKKSSVSQIEQQQADSMESVMSKQEPEQTTIFPMEDIDQVCFKN